MQDKVIFGIVVGLLADAVKLLANYLGYLLNFTHVVFWQITAARFLPKNDLYRPVAYLVGGLADLAVAAALGVAFVYFLSLTGWRYTYIKGSGFGIITWVVLFGSILSHTTQNVITLQPQAIVVTAIAHLLFGLALAFFATKLKQSPIAKLG